MSTEKKAREFWIVENRLTASIGNVSVHLDEHGQYAKPHPDAGTKQFHVIEHSAYSSLLAHADKLAEALDEKVGGKHTAFCNHKCDPAGYYPCSCGYEALADFQKFRSGV